MSDATEVLSLRTMIDQDKDLYQFQSSPFAWSLYQYIIQSSMNNDNIRQTQRGQHSDINRKKIEKELISSAIHSQSSKDQLSEKMTLFKSCKLSPHKVAELKAKAAQLNQEDSLQDRNDNKGKSIMAPTLQQDSFSLNDSLVESMLYTNLMNSSNGLQESVPNHLGSYKYIHMVKPPSYIQDSAVINNLKDSKMIDNLINSNIKLRTTFESQRSHPKDGPPHGYRKY